MARKLVLVGVVAAASGLAIASCSASPEQSPTTSGAGGAASASSGSSTSDTSSNVGTGGGLTSSSSGGGFGGGCAGVSSKAEPIPLDIFVMLDQSGSMLQGAGNGQSRWDSVKSAIGAFVSDPGSDGIGIGIQYFGLPEPFVAGCYQMPCMTDADCTAGCTTCLPQGLCQAPYNPDIDSCDPLDYAWADVAIQPLPGVANAILASMGSHAPGTNTPTQPALEGAIDYAKVWQAVHPDHITVVAFATDGDPSECDIDPAHIEAIAAAGFGDAPSIKTFVIGVGPSLMTLDGIAAAGGTTTAFHVDLNDMATEQFVAAMNTIRKAALACTYEIPPPPDGMTEDFDLVNVTYTPGGGGAKETIPKVDGYADCPANGDGWYYDDSVAPTEIILCPATCDKIGQDLMAGIDIVLGCETILR